MLLKLLIALIAGLVLPLAFAPFGVYTFAFLSPAVLFYLWLRCTGTEAFWCGFAFGLGFFGVGVSWVYISIHVYGSAPVWLAALITILFIMVLALFPATQGYFANRLFGKKTITIRCLCVFPATWVIWEYLRTWLFTGFPWLLLGYSQTTTLLNGYAPVLGVYGLSLVIVLISATLVLLANRISSSIKMLSISIIFALCIIGWSLSKISWTQAASQPFKVSLIQGNIAQQIKWQPQYLQHILNVYTQLTAQHWDSKLIIWPEAAIPTFPIEIQSFMNELNQAAKMHNVYLITGAPIYHQKDKKYYNGLLELGAGQGVYLKRHLVPFGEYMPFQTFFGKIAQFFNFPMSDFSKGPHQQPALKVNNFTIAPFICYEIAYPIAVLNSVIGKNLIVVITDDSWFGDSIALSQHLQIAQMRALETGRDLLMSTNTGVTAFVDSHGKIYKKAPVDIRLVLTDYVKAMQGKTLLMIWNYYPVLGIILLLLLVSISARNVGRSTHSSKSA